MHTLYYCPEHQQLSIRHLLSFNRPKEHENSSSLNLEIFFRILPFTLASDFQYHAYYFYNDSSSAHTRLLFTAFPYFVSGHNWSFLLSSNLDNGVYCPFWELSEYLNSSFDLSLKDAAPLNNTLPSSNDLLSSFIASASTDTHFSIVEYQPCLSAYLTKDMLLKYVDKELPQYEMVIRRIQSRGRLLKQTDNLFFLFNKESLKLFADTGCIMDFSNEYVGTLNKEDRIYLLESLYKEIAKGTQKCYMADPLTFPISEYFCFFTVENTALVFLSYNHQKANYNYILIKERTLINAFCDFTTYLLKTHCVYSQDETPQYIRRCIQGLEKE